jgi:hypothetical protein
MRNLRIFVKITLRAEEACACDPAACLAQEAKDPCERSHYALCYHIAEWYDSHIAPTTTKASNEMIDWTPCLTAAKANVAKALKKNKPERAAYWEARVRYWEEQTGAR